jgi:hypothetical protein
MFFYNNYQYATIKPLFPAAKFAQTLAQGLHSPAGQKFPSETGTCGPSKVPRTRLVRALVAGEQVLPFELVALGKTVARAYRWTKC